MTTVLDKVGAVVAVIGLSGLYDHLINGDDEWIGVAGLACVCITAMMSAWRGISAIYREA